MSASDFQTAILPFPSIPRALAERYAVSEPGLRPFGIDESDLAVDFSKENVPDLVTRILAQCAVNRKKILPAGFFRELTVGKRLECLLRLAAGGEKTAFQFSFKCGSCGQDLEFELTLDEIVERQAEADLTEMVEVVFENQTRVFRKPLGRDQESWRDAAFTDERVAALAMIQSLQIVPPKFSVKGEDFDLIADAMDEADPLINFNCRVRCADCGALNDFPIDLCDFALGELRRAQQFLLRAVHLLASHYHWSEKEIFAVPHWRRVKYLALIANEK